MSVKAIEDTLAVAKVAVPELPEVPGEALNLSLMDDLELGRYIYGTVYRREQLARDLVLVAVGVSLGSLLTCIAILGWFFW